MVISHLLCQLQGQGDILGLGALVAAAEQDDQKVPALHVIDPVSWAVVDTKFADALADRFYVARIAERQATHPTGDFRLGPSVPQTGDHWEKVPVSRTSIICNM